MFHLKSSERTELLQLLIEYQNTRNIISIISLQILSIMLITTLIQHLTAFPVNLPGQAQNSNVGQKVRVSGRAELNSVMNHTVPSILTAGVNPYEYLRLNGHNVTGMSILPYLMSNEIGKHGKF